MSVNPPPEAPPADGPDFSAHRGVWVYIQHHRGEAAPVSWQLLGVARDLAQQIGVAVSAVVLGSGARQLCDAAFAYGADTVYLIDDPVLAD